MDPIMLAMALAKFAPAAIKLLTGSDKAEKAAEAVVGIAEEVTGVKGAATVQALNADPALVLQFRQAMADKQTELERLYLADRADARDRDVKLAQAGRRNVRADLMVLLDVVGLVACLVVLALYRQQLPGEAVGIISTVAGIFGACLRDAHQFEFGSSRGSREKDELLAQRSGGV